MAADAGIGTNVTLLTRTSYKTSVTRTVHTLKLIC